MSSLSFKEKSLWGTLAALVTLSFLYFWSVVEMAAAGVTDLRALGGLGIGLAVVFILVEIVYHLLIAGFSPKEAEAGEDERDRLIELKGSRIGGFLLGLGVVFTIGHIAMGTLFDEASGNEFVTVNLLLFALALSEIGKYIAQLAYYRRGL